MFAKHRSPQAKTGDQIASKASLRQCSTLTPLISSHSGNALRRRPCGCTFFPASHACICRSSFASSIMLQNTGKIKPGPAQVQPRGSGLGVMPERLVRNISPPQFPKTVTTGLLPRQQINHHDLGRGKEAQARRHPAGEAQPPADEQHHVIHPVLPHLKGLAMA